MRKINSKWAIAIGVVLVDQASKFFVLRNFANWAEINFDLGFSLPTIILAPRYIALATLLIVVLLSAIFWKKVNQLAALLVIAGSFSNLADRFYRAGVVDFINLKIWPIFNIADLAISVGLLWLCVDLLRTSSSQRAS